MGGIPILSDVWEAILWSVDFFFHKAPAPLLFLVFILMLILFGTVISFSMHLIGIHCNSKLEPVRVDAYDISANVGIALMTRDVKLTSQILDPTYLYPDLNNTGTRFYWYAKKNTTYSNSFWQECYPDDTGCTYLLPNGDCYNCTRQYALIEELGNSGFGGQPNKQFNTVCTGDAYPLANLSGWTYSNCFGLLGNGKIIPTHYLFNSTDGRYHCVDEDYCGANATQKPISAVDNVLAANGAKLMYPAKVSRVKMENAVFIKCSNNLNPRLTFFGIDLFDYRFWLILGLIGVLFWTLTHFGQQRRL
jgi:hypothetical protein